MAWVRIYESLLDDPTAQRLPPAEFKAAFLAAASGQGGPLAAFVRPDGGRVFSREWAVLRSAVFLRDDFTCAYCGQRGKKLECDHIVPVSRGGSNDMANLTTACRKCNRSKRDKMLSEWVQ